MRIEFEKKFYGGDITIFFINTMFIYSLKKKKNTKKDIAKKNVTPNLNTTEKKQPNTRKIKRWHGTYSKL